MKRDAFLNSSADELVRRLTVDEKIALLSAPNWWNTTPIPRLGIPSVRMSDGPNGVRGSSNFLPVPAQCIPCETSMASTFDPELIRDVGRFLATEAKAKSTAILLAPTCNIQRTPLGGRAFESFSEDPHLSGIMASAYVDGLQSAGVAATIKHFVGNDQEHMRTLADSVMSERALREIYLYPFMLAQKNAQPWSYMTAYGRTGGLHCSENKHLLQSILRDEWKFDGMIMSDWFGTYSVSEALNAGLDLEMPGPPRWRTPLLIAHSLSAGKITHATLTERARSMLAFIQRCATSAPDVVFGTGEETTRDDPEGRTFVRRVASEGMVLLKNEGDILPLEAKPDQRLKVAVIGPNAKDYVISGGGSAALKPSYVVTPWEGLVAGMPENIELSYQLGCYSHNFTPSLEFNLTSPEGVPGWLVTFHKHTADKGSPFAPAHELAATEVARFNLRDTRMKLNDFVPAGLGAEWTAYLRATMVLDDTGAFELGLAVAGRARVYVDGECVLENWDRQTRGEFIYGQGTVEEKAVIDVVAGQPRAVVIEYTNTFSRTFKPEEKEGVNPSPARALRLGGCFVINPDAAIEEAVALAKESDIVIYVGGLTPEWELEGFDRPTLHLPCRQDELIEKLGRANKNTVVVLQAGSAVAMPWADNVNGILQAWYSGNEVGHALADILYGQVNPAGRLPLTLPVRIEDTPSFGSTRCEHGKIHYREDLLVGYKHYVARNIKPLFPFGFGLSYTTFALSDLVVSPPSSSDTTLDVVVSVAITNTGARAGAGVAQLYVTYPDDGVTHPPLQLKAFAKAHGIAPGATRRVEMRLDKYAASYWQEAEGCWKAQQGTYLVRVGDSSESLCLAGTFDLEESFTWKGL